MRDTFKKWILDAFWSNLESIFLLDTNFINLNLSIVEKIAL